MSKFDEASAIREFEAMGAKDVRVENTPNGLAVRWTEEDGRPRGLCSDSLPRTFNAAKYNYRYRHCVEAGHPGACTDSAHRFSHSLSRATT